MRVITGIYGGRKLAEPNNYDVRPTLDKVKGAMFNILMNKIDYADYTVLDVFCGSGALGIEALSRGAKAATFIDNNHESIALTKQNIESLKIENASVINSDVLNLREAKTKHNLIFMDPPYSLQLCGKALQALKNNGYLDAEFIAVIETGVKTEQEFPDWLEIIDERSYGKAKLYFVVNK